MPIVFAKCLNMRVSTRLEIATCPMSYVLCPMSYVLCPWSPQCLHDRYPYLRAIMQKYSLKLQKEPVNKNVLEDLGPRTQDPGPRA